MSDLKGPPTSSFRVKGIPKDRAITHAKYSIDRSVPRKPRPLGGGGEGLTNRDRIDQNNSTSMERSEV